MMPPLPITLAFVILIGYPLLQIAAIRYRRAWRLECNALAAELLGDKTTFRSERHLVRVLLAASREDFDTVRRLARLPSIMFREALNPPAPQVVRAYELSPRAAEFGAKLDRMRHLTIHLEWATWPITFTILAIASVAAGSLGSMIAAARGIARVHIPGLSDIERLVRYPSHGEEGMLYS